MLERFTRDAREVVAQASAEARRLGAPAVGTEHLLIAVAERCPLQFTVEHRPLMPSIGLLGRPGLLAAPVTPATIRSRLVDDDADAAALEAIGISLPEVRRRLEEALGPDVWDAPAPRRAYGPFTREAKIVLELAFREALAIRSKRIQAQHVLLALMRHDEKARRIVSELGVDPNDVYDRARVEVERLARLARHSA